MSVVRDPGTAPKKVKRKKPPVVAPSLDAQVAAAQKRVKRQTPISQTTAHGHPVAATEAAVKQQRKRVKTHREAKKIVRQIVREGKGEEPRARASGIDPATMLFGKAKEPEGSAYDIFVDKKGVGHFSDYASTGTKIVRALTGDKPGTASPTLGEVASIGTTLGASGAGAILKAPAALRAASKVKTAEKAVQAPRAARKASAAKGATKASRAGRRARGGAKARYTKVERKLRRVKRVQGTAHRAVNPIAPAAAQSDPGRALIEGTVKADPKKTAATTARAIPATLAFGATALGDLGRAAATGDTDPLKGTAKEFERATVGMAKRLLSGDPDKVKKTIESEVGYLGVPLIPRALSSRTAKKVAGKIPAPKAKPTGRIETPGSIRRAVQVARPKGKAQRKRVSQIAAREMEPAKAKATRVAQEIDKPLRKVRRDAEDVVATLARYGINRKNPIEQLRQVEKTLDPKDAPAGTVTVREVRKYAEENPGVFKEDGVWDAVEAYRNRVTETSPTAKYRAQGDVFGVRPPEQRITPSAQEMVGDLTRGEAFIELKARKKALKKMRKQQGSTKPREMDEWDRRVVESYERTIKEWGPKHPAAKEAAEKLAKFRSSFKGTAKGSATDVLRYVDEAERVERLHAELDPLSRPGQSLEGKRTRWTRPMVEEYAREVELAAKEAGFVEPAWTSERGPGTVKPEAVGSRASPGARAQHVKTGETARTDVADRSLRALVADSVWRPRMQQALHRFIRRTVEEFSIPVEINGRRVTEVTGREFNVLVGAKKIDSREVVAIPSRDYKQAFKDETFDLEREVTDFGKTLRGEININAAREGDKYVLLPREVGTELVAQITPGKGNIMNTLATAGSRTVLFSPAWMAAQIVAEGLQAGAAVGPVAWARAASTLRQLKRKDPQGYEDFSFVAGTSPASLEQPGGMRLAMEGDTQRQFANAGRALRRTAVGRAVYATGTLRLFGLLDKWKSGKYRTVIAAAKADREFNGFVSGLQGMHRQQDTIANKLKGLSKQEQLSYVARHPGMFDKHLDYVDDVAGNWQAFTRYERSFAPLVMFYPFLRMSLRWTFWSYPKNHPVRAQIVYLLAQQNANEIDKLLGDGNAKFIDYAMPVIHGEGGNVDAVLPGGQRFGGPGLNTLVQTIGEDNVAGLARVLNPALSIPVYATTGVDPMSGLQDPNANRGLLALQQLLSLAPPVRYLGLNRAGEEQSPASKKFEQLDPYRNERSYLVPFLPQSAGKARKEAELSSALDRSGEGVQSEVGQFIEMAERLGLKKATERQQSSEEAKDLIAKLLGDAETPAEKKKVKKIIDAYYKVKYPPQPSSSSPFKTSAASSSPFKATSGAGSPFK